MARVGAVARSCAVLATLGCGAGEQAAADGNEMRVPTGPVTLAVGGDAMLGRAFNGLLAADPDYAIWRGTEESLAGTDILAFNLETTITAHEHKWEGKNWNFQLDPALSEAAFDAVIRDNGVASVFAATANNHALDFNVPGLLETIESLDRSNIAHAGSGVDDKTARMPAIVETTAGVRVAFFAASTVCSCGELSLWNATAHSPGAWMIRSDDDAGWLQAVDAVHAVSDDVDYVVFSLHWGVNYVEAWPVEWMRARGTQLIEAGVDVIYGHSAHHVLPIERIGSGVVLYGTGDLIDDYSGVDGFRNDLSYIGRVSLSPDLPPEVDVIPMRLVHEPDHFAMPLTAGEPDFTTVMAATRWQ